MIRVPWIKFKKCLKRLKQLELRKSSADFNLTLVLRINYERIMTELGDMSFLYSKILQRLFNSYNNMYLL